ncbi:hypothetical protein LCGC14_1248390 [marine sediment metagenome]|uniref:Uncharacterized protein n=1 Tax=marine sediment metagenome TaxID=412755 RepID=A0A0F9NL31_9ZZZZ
MKSERVDKTKLQRAQETHADALKTMYEAKAAANAAAKACKVTAAALLEARK